jgi:hypothetical protein
MDGVDGWMEGRQNGVRGNEERMKDDEEGSKGMMEWWWWKVEREVQSCVTPSLDYYGSGPTHPHHQHTKDAPTVLQGG